MGKKTLLILSLFIIFSILWYLLFIRKYQPRKSALIRLVENTVNRKFVDRPLAELEEELLSILQERDDIIEDRFDRLIKGCLILDVDRSMDRDGFFRYLAMQVALHLGSDKDVLHSAFIDREKTSSTNIVEGIAIPHIIIPGPDKFDLVLARSRKGIIWNPGDHPVHAVFTLLGSEDQRNYHLRALMAIAQLVQHHDFLSHWQKAPDAEAIRSNLLLAPRKRDSH